MKLEDVQFLNSLRLRMQQNVAAERPKDEGISKDELARVVSILRSKRVELKTQAEKKPATKRKMKSADVAAATDDDIKRLFGVSL